MQGTWKENISGWNQKDSKRKKQSRKHTLKDKAKTLIKKFKYKNIKNKVIWDEGGVEFIKDSSCFKQSGWVESWKVEVETYIGKYKFYWNSDYFQNRYSYSVRTAYWNNGWFDDYDNTPISGPGVKVKKLNFLYKEEIKYDTPIEIKPYRGYRSTAATKETVFIYGKPICVDYWNKYRFWSTKRRKYGQQLVNRKERSAIRDWVKKEDWESEIPTNDLTKSIAWLVN